MNKEIFIRALTPKGTDVLKQHFKEFNKMNAVEKLKLKLMGYKHEEVTLEPYCLLFSISKIKYQQPHFIEMILIEIRTALESNGAIENKDYGIEIK